MSVQLSRTDPPLGYAFVLTISDPVSGITINRHINPENESDYEDIMIADHLWQTACLWNRFGAGPEAGVQQQAAAIMRIFPSAVLAVEGEVISLTSISVAVD